MRDVYLFIIFVFLRSFSYLLSLGLYGSRSWLIDFFFKSYIWKKKKICMEKLKTRLCSLILSDCACDSTFSGIVTVLLTDSESQRLLM